MGNMVLVNYCDNYDHMKLYYFVVPVIIKNIVIFLSIDLVFVQLSI